MRVLVSNRQKHDLAKPKPLFAKDHATKDYMANTADGIATRFDPVPTIGAVAN
jgi:hypothetical protein